MTAAPSTSYLEPQTVCWICSNRGGPRVVDPVTKRCVRRCLHRMRVGNPKGVAIAKAQRGGV